MNILKRARLAVNLRTVGTRNLRRRGRRVTIDLLVSRDDDMRSTRKPSVPAPLDMSHVPPVTLTPNRSLFGTSMDASVKWVATESGRLRVADEARDMLANVNNGQPLGIVTVVGSARQGKSFLMNALTGSDTTFCVSPEVLPCTAGADLSPNLMPLCKFISLGSKYPRVPRVTSSSDPMIGFVDMEGQGDRSAESDVRLATPFLLISQASDGHLGFVRPILTRQQGFAKIGPPLLFFSDSCAYS